jgi:FADH2 O2-dependent halogenase
MEREYDIVVIGSGLAGSTTALCLSASGLKTLVVERKSHPRFVVGESTVPAVTQGFRRLAETFDVPELAAVSDFIALHRRGLTVWPKQHFWFGMHQEGQPLDPRDELMAETLRLPVGPDSHMLRSDLDGWLVSLLPRYGVDYVDHTDVVRYDADDRRAVVTLRNGEAESAVRARFVVDASGHASFLARQFELREEPSRLETNTRTIFAHFTGIPPLDDVLGAEHPSFRFKRHGGSMHHCFHGGWAWVIPLRDDLVSVGLSLDREVHPFDPDLPAEREIETFLSRYPSMRQHLGEMEPVRPLTKTDRVQFSCRTILGPRFILTPHASGFVDPLFSSGILLSQAFVARFVPAIEEAVREDDFSRARFEPMERAFFRELDAVDRFVSGAIASYRHAPSFLQYIRTWLYAESSQLARRTLGDCSETDGPTLLYATAEADFVELLAELHREITDPSADVEAFAVRARAALDARLPESPWYPRPDFGGGGGTVCLTEPSAYPEWLDALVARHPELAETGPDALEEWISTQKELALAFIADYRGARPDAAPLIEGIDRVRALRTRGFARLTATLDTPLGVEELVAPPAQPSAAGGSRRA